MSDVAKVEFLVVDTSAFIKNIPLQELGTNIITVQAVVDEILNKRQLRNLVVLPYELQIKDAFPEDVKHVTEFSKMTGDYICLSATDIQVMALAYRLEKEKVGTDHLKKEPVVHRVVKYLAHLVEGYKGIAGFYQPPGKEKAVLESTEAETLGKETHTTEDELRNCEDIGVKGDGDEVDNKDSSAAANVIQVKQKEENAVLKVTDTEMHTTGDSESEGEEYLTSSDDDDEDSDEMDDSDWITPANIAKVKQEMPSDVGTTGPVVVACITSDFAMQNVLKQMGMQVLSIDGRKIQQLRTFILRCYSCFKTTSIMTKLFCPHCGNKTLKRVAVSLREDGTQEIHLSARKRITGRGKRFSLPRPQGGKHANNPILCEDQRIPHQRPSRLARTKTDPLDPDYVAGFSPFVMRDVTSRAAMLGIRNVEVKNWMRKNPNEVLKKGRKKKK